jgi:PAS domain S-box-containing protein
MSWRLKDLSIRSQAILLVVTMFVPTGAMFFYDRATQKREFETRSLGQAAATSRQIMEEDAKLLESGKLILDLLSEVPAVRNFDPVACHQLFASLRADYPRFMSFGVFRPNGDRVCGSRQVESSYNVASRSWFQLAVETRAFAVGQYQIGMVSGRPSLGLAKPLIDSSDTIRGVVYAALDLDWLGERAGANLLPAGGSFLVVDRAGTILSIVPRPGSGSLGTGASIPQSELFAAMKSSRTGSSRELPGIDGRPLLFYFFNLGPTADAGIYAAVGLPLEPGRAEANARAWSDIAVLAIGALATLAVGYLISDRMIVQPLSTLAAFSRAVGDGGLGRRTGLGDWRNEIGELARNLDGMVESLARHRAERLERNRLILETEEAGHFGSWQWIAGSKTGRCTPELARIFRIECTGDNLVFADAFNRLHTEDRDRIKRVLDHVVATGGRSEVEFRLLFADGEIRHCVSGLWVGGDENGTPVVHGFTQDITERKKAEAKEEYSAKFLEAMLDNIKDGIIACNIDGELVVFNRSLEDLYGARLDELRGQSWIGRFDVYRPDAKVRLKREELPLWRALHGERISNEELTIKAVGKSYSVIVNAQEIRNNLGERLGAVVTIRDITDLRRTEVALRHAQKLEAVGLLSSGIAHDFNNLLSVVIGNLDSLILRLKDEKQRDLATEALDGALRGAGLVKQMLAFARRQQLEPESLLVSDFVREVVGVWARVAGDKIPIEMSFPDNLSHCIADPGELEAALLHLITNARDAMPDGGTITIEACNQRLDQAYAAENLAATPGDYIKVSVTDTGTGIPPENLSRVMEPFFTTKDPGQGTGLGLSMVYGFAKQSGGHLRIYSEVGQGTTVSLYLPSAPAGEVEPDLPEPSGGARGMQSNRVLVVDDDDEVRNVAVELLQEMGCEVVEATSADRAIAALEQGAPFGLVLCDVVMPGERSGFDLAEFVLERFPSAKVILLTGFAEHAAKGRPDITDRIELISKPYRRRELADRIHRLLAQ